MLRLSCSVLVFLVLDELRNNPFQPLNYIQRLFFRFGQCQPRCYSGNTSFLVYTICCQLCFKISAATVNAGAIAVMPIKKTL